MTIDVPSIKTISTQVTPTEVREALNTMGRYFAMLDKAGGTPTADELVASGLAAYDAAGKLQPVEPVAQTPTAPTGFSVSGSFAKIFVEWDDPAYLGHSHTEIWRAQVDDLGQAVKVGVSSWSLYPDFPPSNVLSEKYYYWARHINRNGIPGPYNSTSGSFGATADSPEYVLDLLVDAKWKAVTSRDTGFLGYPSRPNGYAYKATTGGVSGWDEPVWPETIGATVVDGAITWKCEAAVSATPPFEVGLVNGVVKTVIKSLMIGDATITNAMVKELAADKILAGTMNVALTLTAANIIGGSLNINNRFVVDSTGTVTIKSAVSGARLEVRSNVIKVYDANNVLRVKLGDLTA